MKTKLWRKLLVVVGCFGSLWLATQQPAKASAGAGFSVKAEQPVNQKDKNVSYFDLATKPGAEQTLKVKLTNTGNSTKELSVSPNDAFTNRNGVIEYSSRNVAKTGTAKYQLSDLISEPQEVKLAGRQSKTLKFKLKVPKAGFRGSILGGFYVKPTKQAHKSSKAGMKINNEFAMLVGIHLHGQGTAKPNLKLNQVKTGRENDAAVLKATLENTAPTVITRMKVKANVTKKGETKSVLKHSQKEMQLAPNSKFNWQLPVDDTLAAGEYTLHLTATHGRQKWQLSRNFTVKENVTKFNTKLDDRQSSSRLPWYYAVIGGTLVIAIAILAFMLGRRRHN